jgi:hypothetical protein
LVSNATTHHCASPVTIGHTGIISPNFASHVGDWLTTSACHVEDQQPIIASHVGGTTLVVVSHTDITYPTFVHHVGDEPPASIGHVESMSPAIVNDIGDIHTVEKPRRVRRKPKFLCRICEGDHLTRLCPTTAWIPEAWSSPRGPSGSETSLVSQHSVSHVVDTMVMSMQSLADTPLTLGVDASLDLVVSHLVQPTVLSMQYPTDTTPIFGGDASLDLVVSHLIQPMIE